ncbi:MAG: Lrp/AsnC family transcriptional regulator [Candidatus Thorarchaeota archaeon]|jgi:DNA-binding Lrp family transcriptional regulator
MDQLDKNILLELDSNCRQSYEIISRKLGVSANAIKKRVAKMIETGVIEQFVVLLMPAMTGANLLLAQICTNGKEDQEDFIEQLGDISNVLQVGSVASSTSGMYNILAEYVGTEGLSKLRNLLSGLENADDVELHILLRDTGERMEFSNLHLRVLRALTQDPRMRVSDIASQTKLTARRVSKITQELLDSRALWFATRWNLSAGYSTQCRIRIDWDPKIKTYEEIDSWIRNEYPLEYWESFVSAAEPVMFARFVVDHIRKVEPISRRIKREPFAISANALIYYPVKKFPRLGMTMLEDMLKEKGY